MNEIDAFPIDFGPKPETVAFISTISPAQIEGVLESVAAYLEPRFLGEKGTQETKQTMQGAINQWVEHWIEANAFPREMRGKIGVIVSGTHCVVAWRH